MQKLFLFLFLFPFAVRVSSQSLKVSVTYILKSTSANNDTIYYNPERKLKWADFKGKPPAGSTLEAAITASGYAYDARIVYDNNTPTLQVGVFCFFTKHNSWRRENLADSFHLKHEQSHFDITFLSAMKFINEIQETHFTYKNFGSTLNSIFKKTMAENNQWQDQYDTETSHSLNEAQQNAWNKKIASLVAKAASSLQTN